MNKFLKFLQGVFAKPDWRCIVCGKDLFGEEKICQECESKLKRIEDGKFCLHCGRKTEMHETYCSTCKNNLTETDIARSSFDYEYPTSFLIKKYKIDGAKWLVDFFAEELVKTFEASGYTADFVTNIPMTEKAVRKRGFNQTELLAKNFSERTGIEYKSVVVKTKETKNQRGLNRADRLTNLADAFHVSDRKSVKDKNVLVIDDVTTTGATGEAMATKLKRSGARRVMLLTVASVSDIKIKGER